MREQLLAVIATMGSIKAATYYNQNYLPYVAELRTCTDTDYHTECDWNQCCGYLSACCDRDSAADKCAYGTDIADPLTAAVISNYYSTSVSLPDDIAARYPECRDPYD